MTILKAGEKHISRGLKQNDIKPNEFVIRDKYGDPLAIGQAPTRIPRKYQNL